MMDYLQMGKEFTRTLSFLKHRALFYFIGMLGMSLMLAVIPVVQAMIIKKMIEAAEFKQMSLLVEGIYLLIVSLLCLCIFIPLFRYMYNACAKRTEGDLQVEVFNHRSTLPIRYFENNHSGILLSRLTNDVTTMTGLYTGRLRRLIAPVIYGLTAAVPMFLLDWRLALGLVTLNVISMFFNVLYTKPIRRISSEIQHSLGMLSSRIVDILSGFTVIKLYPIRTLILNKYSEQNRRVTEQAINREKKGASLDSLNYLLGIISTMFVLIVGAMMVSWGETTFGTLFALMFLQMRLNRSFLEVGLFIPEVQNALAGSERVFTFLDEKSEPTHYSSSQELKSESQPYLSMKDVHFTYGEFGSVLDGVTFSVEQGQTVGFVGESGGGKSTIFKLLLGFFPANHGTMTIAGKYVGEWTLKELREQIAYVPQTPYLFNGTIKENIRFGSPDANQDAVMAAAKAAFAHDFILQQPKGYETMVGEQGSRLSGGQKQRIAIARAILKDAPILLLDEATSALDSESEYWVQKAIEKLKENRTTLCIAHRLSTIEEADAIFVINKGRVVEHGTHEALIKNGQYYKDMVKQSER
ncbi:ABC transporter ATP-binding protein [Halalkalibacter urbisdiaboli]|uniref:ABC transporter ATP-binding protein n=1 Tax=Halalkalibacter urbisdiaboli TaxID=1960589 RepID=UPI000B436682|nr:ABC transporter ATP-binding protein [Halalkalibacter urbisdiaboli]